MRRIAIKASHLCCERRRTPWVVDVREGEKARGDDGRRERVQEGNEATDRKKEEGADAAPLRSVERRWTEGGGRRETHRVGVELASASSGSSLASSSLASLARSSRASFSAASRATSLAFRSAARRFLSSAS